MEVVASHLVSCSDQDPNIRIQAELHLKKVYLLFTENDANTTEPAASIKQYIQTESGFLTLLIQIIISESIPETTKQAAAIYFKNQVGKFFEASKETAVDHPDRIYVKDLILRSIISSSPSVRSQLLASLNKILRADYPENWPSFLQNLIDLLNVNDPVVFYSALEILKELVSVYRWKSAENRLPLNHIIASTFPLIISKTSSIVTSNDLLAGSICHYIAKTYHHSIEFEVSDSQQESNSLVQWGNFFISIIEKDIPIDPTITDNKERADLSWWRAKKWSYSCIYKIYSKYSNPSFHGSKGKYSVFGKIFLDHFVPEILGKYLKQIDLYVNGVWLSDPCKQQLCLFFTECVVYKRTWEMMKPTLDNLLRYFIFPQLCFTSENQELWDSDPVEFIQMKLDPMQDFKSPQSAAKDLLVTLVKNRKKQTLIPIVQFVHQILQTSSSQNYQDQVKRDGAIALISSISEFIMTSKSPIYNDLEPFINNYILPEFNSTQPFLRGRACEAMQSFAEMEKISTPVLQNILTGIVNCLQDESLIVKVSAALALRPLLVHEAVQDLLKPNVGIIMQILLQIANEIDMDTITDVMESFVDNFSDELIPFAVQLGSQLRDTFTRIVGEMNLDPENTEVEETTDKMMTASGIVKTIGTLIIAVESSPEVLKELEKTILPVCLITIQRNIIDLYADIFDVIDICTYSSKSISSDMWQLLPIIYESYKSTSACDFIEEILPCIDNYLIYGSEVVKSNIEYQKMFLDFAFTIFSRTDDPGEQDLVRGCQIFESVLLNLRGSGVEQFIPDIITAIARFIRTTITRTPSFKVHSLEVVINCLYCNPLQTLQVLEQHVLTEIFFAQWFGTLDDFIRVHDIKLSVLTLCKLMQIDQLFHIPNFSIQTTVAILKLMDEYPEAIKERERVSKMMKGEGSENEGSDDDEDLEIYENEDLEDGGIEEKVETDANAYLESMVNAAEEAEDSDDDDDFFTSGLEEDPFFETVLDKIDINLEIKGAFSSLSPSIQQNLVAVLSQEHQASLQKLMMN